MLGEQVRFERDLSEVGHGSRWSEPQIRTVRLLSREQQFGGLFVNFLCFGLVFPLVGVFGYFQIAHRQREAEADVAARESACSPLWKWQVA
jgi:hypothetical protein